MKTINEILFFQNVEKTNIDLVLNRLEEYMLLYKNIGSPFITEEKEIEIKTEKEKENISIKIEEKIVSIPEPIPTPTPKPMTVQVNNIQCLKEAFIETKQSNEIKIDPNMRTKNLRKENRNTINPFLLPKQKDTLFWCLYIAKHGYVEYELINRNYGVKELEIKTKVADFMKANPAKMKETNYKITKVLIQEIMSELLTMQKETSMFCLLAILVYFDMNVVMIEHTSRVLLEFISNKTETAPTFLIERDQYARYHIKEEPITVDEIAVLKTDRICLDNFMKPIHSMSSYKIGEIEDILCKIGVLKKGEETAAALAAVAVAGKKLKKQDLYELLRENVKW